MGILIQNVVPVSIGVALFILAWAVIGIFRMLRHASGDQQMQSMAGHIQEGARAWLHRHHSIVVLFAVVIFLLLAFLLPVNGWHLAIGFLVGAVLSATAGHIGMSVAVRTNVRTTEAAKTSLQQAFHVAFSGASIAGFLVGGLALLGVASFLYYLTAIAGLGISAATESLIGFGFGASLISLFARVGGGIFSKAADLGADLVGKIEADIPEDDPRNPATIADNVGDNVGDGVGMGADLFETYTITMIAAMVLAAISLGGESGLTELHVLLPLAVGGVSLIATFVGILFVRLGKKGIIMRALYRGMLITIALAAAGLYVINDAMTGDITIFYAGLVGYAMTVLITLSSEYSTSAAFGPVKDIAAASETGAATNIITGLTVGMHATAAPVFIMLIGMIVSFHFAAFYGIAIAAVAMLSIAGMIIAFDSYGSITDNADGIAEMTEQPAAVRTVTSTLDAVGNTTKAATKGYAIGAAVFAAIVLFQAYRDSLMSHNPDLDIVSVFSLASPAVLVGLFIGALLPFIFSAYCMRAVSRIARLVVVEVRRQFREITGILDGSGKPEYATCVDVMAQASIRGMLVPAAIAIFAPIITGYLFGPAALAGLLLGVIITGFLLGLTMVHGGSAWDNAKKYIEDRDQSGKGSLAHQAATVGDMVGDPCKDTAGPAINALIKVVSMVALILASTLASWGGLIQL